MEANPEDLDYMRGVLRNVLNGDTVHLVTINTEPANPFFLETVSKIGFDPSSYTYHQIFTHLMDNPWASVNTLPKRYSTVSPLSVASRIKRRPKWSNTKQGSNT